jgi:multidrug efflux system membrane fusion protein
MNAPQTRRRGWLRWLIVLVLAVIAAWLLYRLFAAPAPAARATPPQTVGVAKAETADMDVTEQGLGTVTPLATITVKTQINGLLQSLGFNEGQIVQRGQFLAQIDPRPYQAALDQAEGALRRDQALLAQARRDDERYEKLNRQDSISRQQAEDQLFLVHQDEGLVASDQGTAEAQRVNLIYCHITAPVTGRVGLRQVDAGNYVQTSDTNGLVVVTQLQPISVIFTLPEDDLPAIMAQLRAGVTLGVTLFDRANTTQIATGTLETVDNVIDTTTGTVKLRAIFANADTALFPSQFVNATLLVSTVKGAVTVPNAAIQTGAPGSFAYVVGADSKVSVRKLRLGVADASRTQIISGLQAGETVVVDGVDRLRDGARVTLPGAAPKAGTGSTGGTGGTGRTGGAGGAGNGGTAHGHHRHQTQE